MKSLILAMSVLLITPLAPVAETPAVASTAPPARTLAAPRLDVTPSTPGKTRHVASAKPTFSLVAAAPAGGPLWADFELRHGATLLKQASKPVKPGQTATTGFDLEQGVAYEARGRLHDATGASEWSSPIKLVIDTQKPATPVLTAKSGKIVVTSAADVRALRYTRNGGPLTTVATNGKPVTIPQGDVTVQAVDTAGNLSQPTTFTAQSDPVTLTNPSDGDNTARRISLTATGTSGYTGATFQYRRGESDTWKTVPAANTVKTADGSAITWPVPVSNGVSTPLTWTATDTLTEDGTISVRAAYSATSGTVYSAPADVLVDRDGGSAPTTNAGPGMVNLLTGDYTLEASDVTLFGAMVGRTSSSRRPTLGTRQEGQVPIFGPQWASGVIATQTQSDYTGVRSTSSTSVQVMRQNGGWVDFTLASGGAWTPQPGAESLKLTGSLSGTFTLTDTDGTTTTFTRNGTAWQVSATYLPTDNSTTKVVGETVSGLVRPKVIISPTSAAAASTCETAPQTKGCRVLQFVYATTTGNGDYAGRVKQILQWATDPGASAATSVAVAAYAYDSTGRLTQAWDPRISPTVKTAYAYDSAGRVVNLTPPGELPWTFTYGKAGTTATAGEGMLLTASRATLTQGSATATDGGTATTWMMYGVPLTGAAAPYRMGGTDVAGWGQSDVPTDATAVFPPDELPNSHDGGTYAYPGDYWYSTVYYMDASGREVNTASPGGAISATDYDHEGRPTRDLTARNRGLAISASGDEQRLGYLGLTGSTPAQRADLLSTTTVYGPNGRELERFGPLHMVSLAGELYSPGMPYLSPGAWVAAREHTVFAYDAGRPADGTAKVSDQLTSTTVGANVQGYATDGDPRVTTTAYDWAKGLPTATVTDPGGLAITKSTTYDGQGRVVKTALPKSSGSDAGATTTTYWSATGTGTCAGRPEWADLPCRTAAAAAITGGGANPTALPITTTQYNRDGRPTTLTEVAGSVTRTRTLGYDAADRATTSSLTGGAGTAVPSRTVTYDQASGKIAQTATSAGTVSYGYDALGRQISYADGAGGTTTTAYDALDRTVKISNNVPSTTTYTYDADHEPRGLPISMTDSVAGTFTAAYDANGALETGTLPGGVTMSVFDDESGAPVERSYQRSDGSQLLYDWADRTIHGQWAARTLTTAQTSQQDYTYDQAGRLTSGHTTTNTVCTTRAYGYDRNANRTFQAVATAAPQADCPSTSTGTPHGYDSADRLVDTGYAYDALGRTTSQPGGVTTDYYADDLVQRQASATTRQTWTLDAGGRLGAWTTENNIGGTWQQAGTKVNHYAGDGDQPAWIIENGGATRMVGGMEGQLAATTTSGATQLILTDLHGDAGVVLTGSAATQSYDEFGNPAQGQTSGRYGWQAAFGRSTETPSGQLLMGVRLYSPALGRFLQTDPVASRDTGAYDFAGQDPLASQDLNGMVKRLWKKKWFVRYALKLLFNRSETKNLRDWSELFSEFFGNFYMFAPMWWARDMQAAIAAFLGYIHTLAQIAARMKRCVWIECSIWGGLKAWFYGPGGYCK